MVYRGDLLMSPTKESLHRNNKNKNFPLDWGYIEHNDESKLDLSQSVLFTDNLDMINREVSVVKLHKLIFLYLFSLSLVSTHT